MSEEAIKAELHGVARLQVALARMDGHRIDKRLMRFDALVECAMQYGRASAPALQRMDAIARDAMRSEVVGQCVIGDRDYTGSISDYAWMAAKEGILT